MVILNVKEWLASAPQERQNLINKGRLSQDTVKNVQTFVTAYREVESLNRKFADKKVDDLEYMEKILFFEPVLKRSSKSLKKSGELDRVLMSFPAIKHKLGLYIELKY